MLAQRDVSFVNRGGGGYSSLAAFLGFSNVPTVISFIDYSPTANALVVRLLYRYFPSRSRLYNSIRQIIRLDRIWMSEAIFYLLARETLLQIPPEID